jgi:TolA-binding protein
MYDDYSRVIKTVNNIGVGRYDVIVVTGSTLPTNRYAQLEFYMEAYKMGIIDRQEVLKKTEVFDQEGVLMRMDEIAKMQGQIQQMDETIKGLKGDLQTAQRETMHAKQESELARFKNELSGNSQAVQHATKLHQERLGDELAMQKERANLAIQKATLGIKNKQRNKTKKPTPSIK